LLHRVLPFLKESVHADSIKSALFGLSYYAVVTAMQHFTKA
jgi:hypothetical protein